MPAVINAGFSIWHGQSTMVVQLPKEALRVGVDFAAVVKRVAITGHCPCLLDRL